MNLGVTIKHEVTVKQVDYHYIVENIERIAALTNEAFIGNHKITRDAYDRTEQKYRQEFTDLFISYTSDSMKKIDKNRGMFFVAEIGQQIVGISVGCDYGKDVLSEQFIERVSRSESRFKDTMAGWWDLMEKYKGTPPGRIYHQATMAIDPAYAGKGIGAIFCELTKKRLIEMRYDGYAVETSSESSDRLAEKMKNKFQVIDIDSNEAGLTLRLHLQSNENSEKIHQWFLSKKKVAGQVAEKETHIPAIKAKGRITVTQDRIIVRAFQNLPKEDTEKIRKEIIDIVRKKKLISEEELRAITGETPNEEARREGRYKLLWDGGWAYHWLVLSGQDQAEFVSEYFSEALERARSQDPDDQEIGLVGSSCRSLLSELLNDADEEKTRALRAQQELIKQQASELWKARKAFHS